MDNYVKAILQDRLTPETARLYKIQVSPRYVDPDIYKFVLRIYWTILSEDNKRVYVVVIVKYTKTTFVLPSIDADVHIGIGNMLFTLSSRSENMLKRQSIFAARSVLAQMGVEK